MDGTKKETTYAAPILILLVTLLMVITTILIEPLPVAGSEVHLYAEARKSNWVKKDSTVIFLEAVVQETKPITNITMKGSMTTPTGEKKTFTLVDNGIGKDGDEIKGDGIYAVAVTGLEPYGNGTYKFVIEAYKAKKFRKRYTLSVKIDEFQGLGHGSNAPLCLARIYKERFCCH